MTAVLKGFLAHSGLVPHYVLFYLTWIFVVVATTAFSDGSCLFWMSGTPQCSN